MASYWLWGSVYIVLDLTGWLSRYKVQPGTNQPPDGGKFTKMLAQVLFNQVVIGALLAWLSYQTILWMGANLDHKSLRTMPTYTRVIAEVPFHIMSQEFGFYYSHRYKL
jgi:fatty acid hydroxylase domain-containing protein 2